LRRFDVAIAGATGLVGREIVRALERRHFPVASLHLLHADRAGGQHLFVNHHEVDVKDLSNRSFENIDVALFAANAETSQHFVPAAVKSGARVIDASPAFRLEPWVPLVVPDVNADDLDSHQGIVSSPSCVAAALVTALQPLHTVNRVRRAVVDTYQAVSANGAAAMEELTGQTKLVLEGQNVVPHFYPHQIAFNVLPEIDVFFDNGYSREEWKLVQETRKLLHAEDMAISATCARVPVFVGDSEAVHVELTEPMSVDQARALFAETPGLRLLDDPSVNLYPHPWAAAGHDEVLVGRIRQDASHPRGLVMWVVADNLRKAALNVVQILETMVARELI